jgi:hypothetical protein
MVESSRRRSLLALGAVVIVVGIIGAVAMWMIAGQRRSNAIDDFARAPVGCDTTLDFAESGTYFLFAETRGEIGEIRGDCDVVGEYDAVEVGPDASFQIVDPDGESLDLDLSDELSYDEGGFVGEAVLEFEVSEPGDHVVRVQSENDELFVAAIGRDPSDGVAALRVAAAIIAATALVLGGLALLFGSRGRPVSGPATGDMPWATTPPFTPAQQRPPGPPIYGQPQAPPSVGQVPARPSVPMPPPPAPGTPPPPPGFDAGGPGWAPQPPQPPPPPVASVAPPATPGQAGFGVPPAAPASPPPPSPASWDDRGSMSESGVAGVSDVNDDITERRGDSAAGGGPAPRGDSSGRDAADEGPPLLS